MTRITAPEAARLQRVGKPARRGKKRAGVQMPLPDLDDRLQPVKVIARGVGTADEMAEQTALFQLVSLNQGRVPELALLFHIPNGGKRDWNTGAQLKRAGVRAGVPDMALMCARQGFHGLFIELKTDIGRVRDTQVWWHSKLREQGYRVEVCRGGREAWNILTDYLGVADDGFWF